MLAVELFPKQLNFKSQKDQGAQFLRQENASMARHPYLPLKFTHSGPSS